MNNQNNFQNEQWNEFRSRNQEQVRNKKTHKGLKVFLIILAVCIAILIILTITGVGTKFIFSEDFTEQTYNTNVQHISTIEINGEISESDTSQIYEMSTYNQQWLIDTIDSLTNEDNNEGILLYLNTPGGSVYATDEVYLKLMGYKQKTGKPIYAAMGPTCASGGYYIACAADKIFANRNTVTGSIGVTMGTALDISELLKQYGIKTTTLASGANKAMGSMYSPLTQEQINIYMSMINEAYDQFTGIVVNGRHMDIQTVKNLADGRIYTAQQAANNGLIDGVLDYENTVKTFTADLKLDDCPVNYYSYEEKMSVYDMIFGLADKFLNKKASSDNNELATALKMAEDANYCEPYYLMN